MRRHAMRHSVAHGLGLERLIATGVLVGAAVLAALLTLRELGRIVARLCVLLAGLGS